MVSIIVPVYNAEETIERCIDSIRHQTYENIEIIAIDDGSVDSTLEILNKLKYKDSRLFVYSQENRGVSYTRNRGIMLSKGEYIQFVDSDDIIHSTMTEELLFQMNNSDLDMVMCLFEYSNRYTKHIDGFCEYSIEGFFEHFSLLMDNVLFQGPCNKIYRSKIIKQNEIKFPEEISKLEDSIFNALYLKYCARIALLPRPLYKYCYVENSLSHRFHIDEIEAMLKVYDIFDSILVNLQNNKERICDKVFCYAIKQMETVYRVSWISDKRTYKEKWQVYQNSIIRRNGFDMLAPYSKKSGIKLRVFFFLQKKSMYCLTIVYFKIIETIKKVVRHK